MHSNAHDCSLFFLNVERSLWPAWRVKQTAPEALHVGFVLVLPTDPSFDSSRDFSNLLYSATYLFTFATSTTKRDCSTVPDIRRCPKWQKQRLMQHSTR